ncbi:MAG: hypothetical protein JXB62_11035 [Pirellulales bacterium]|nr:hypothetical protein [Pirellulales bacterium]
MLRFLATGAVLVGLAACCGADEAKVALKTEIPEEILAGTPPEVLAMLFPNLEKPPEGEPPEFLVPKGTVNLALKKRATASDTNPILGKIAFVTDGNKQGNEQSYVELAPGKQWVQIDLEKPSRVFAVYLWHYFHEARSYHDVVVQVAADAGFTKNVHTLYNCDQDGSLGLGVGKNRPYIETYFGKLIDARGAEGRFLRLYSNGNTANDLNHYVEVEIFGKPVDVGAPSR